MTMIDVFRSLIFLNFASSFPLDNIETRGGSEGAHLVPESSDTHAWTGGNFRPRTPDIQGWSPSFATKE